MFKKIREYFKGKNPYLLASTGIVILSVVIISILLKDEMSAGQDVDTATQQSWEEIVEDTEQEQESVETESTAAVEDLEILIDKEESEIAGIIEPEKTEASESEETEPSEIEGTQKEPEDPVTELPATPEPEKTPAPTPEIEAKESAVPDEIPDTQPEPSVPQEPEMPEDITEVEGTPAPEMTPVPEAVPSPEVEPKLEPEPSPEELPTSHEHSWIFESWYQEPTCSNGGLVNEICAHCGETQVTGGTPTGNHDLQVETPGDCCSQEVVVCTHCNYREVRETDPSNHIDVEDGFCYGCGKKTD